MRFSFVTSLESIGAEPGDSVELRTQKRVLVVVSSLVAFLAIFWSALYLAFGERVAAIIPITYMASVSVSLVVFSKTHRYKVFRFSQLGLILVLPFCLQLALGGFVSGSVVILWSLLAPVGALAIAGRAQAIRWMIAYMAIVASAQVIQPSLGIANNLPIGVITGFFVMNLVGPTAVAFFAMHYFVGQKDEIADQLDMESEKSERLLLNVLPHDIAAELKETGQTEARSFRSATVLFADIVGFTSMSEAMDPAEMLSLLNDTFSFFDTLAERFGIEKIRTIGDNYMAVAGVPVERSDHATAMAGMALAMASYQDDPTSRFRFRIGLSSGPVVAGVVGKSKFHYDVWGDTVNTASRMESQGVPRKIQISSATYDLLRFQFRCEPRGTVEIKGKGEMATWFLIGTDTVAETVPPGAPVQKYHLD